jgi:hypothetical protein
VTKFEIKIRYFLFQYGRTDQAIHRKSSGIGFQYGEHHIGSMRPVLFVLEIDIVTPSKTFTFAHDLPFADYVQEINEEGLRGGVVLNLDFDITSETELEAEVLQASRMIFGNLIDMMKK